VKPVDVDAKVEWYAGYKGDEAPHAVLTAGVRCEVRSVLSRHRVFDQVSGLRRDVWRCRLDDGRIVIIELLEGGTLHVSPEG
jgi:hypothetical protein